MKISKTKARICCLQQTIFGKTIYRFQVETCVKRKVKPNRLLKSVQFNYLEIPSENRSEMLIKIISGVLKTKKIETNSKMTEKRAPPSAIIVVVKNGL